MQDLTDHSGTCEHPGTMTSGLDLKLARTRERLKAKTIAEAMGISQSRIAHIEREAVVSTEMTTRYLNAVAQCRTLGTSEGSAA